MVRAPALASSIALLRVDLAWGQLLLFTGPGYSTTYRQAWVGWYHAGHVSTAEGGGLPMLAGHNGKRGAYDSAGLSAVRFGDSSGAFVEYDLIAPFLNKSLLQIVQACTGGPRSRSSPVQQLIRGCSWVGTLSQTSGISHVAKHLRVGWGSTALFALQGEDRTSGSRPYAVGSRDRTNPGTVGRVNIHGIQRATQAAGDGPWATVTRPCGVDAEGCAHSPNFPRPYNDSQHCVLTLRPQQNVRIQVRAFSTEARHDVLTVNGRAYSGQRVPEDLLFPSGKITWSSDHSLADAGWRLCPVRSEAPPEAAQVRPGAGGRSPLEQPRPLDRPQEGPPTAGAQAPTDMRLARLAVLVASLALVCLGLRALFRFAARRRNPVASADKQPFTVTSDEDGLLS